MSEVGRIFVKLELDDSNFQKGMTGAQATAEKGGNFLSNAFSFATGNLISGGLTTIAGKIVDVGKSMISGNAEFERYQTQFGVLLGSTDAAKQRLQELAKFGASTPFELPELVRADKVLQSFGIHSEELLTTVGDVASGTGASFEDMALLMGKFSAGATGEALSRFQELGVATKDELAKMGIEFDKAGSMTTPVAQAMPILEQLMKDKFGGMMAAQSQTFEGMTSNLQDWVGSTIRTLGAPIFDVVKDKLGALLAFLNDPATMEALNGFATALASGIGVAMDFLANTVIPALTTAWNALSPAVQQSGGIFSSFQGVLQAVWAVFQDQVIPIINNLAAVVMPLLNAALQVGAAFWTNVLVPAVKLLWSLLTTFVLPVLNTLTSVLAVILPPAIQLLASFFTGVLFPAINSIYGFISTYILPIFAIVQEWLAGNLPAAIQTTTDYWNTVLLPALNAVWNFISTYIIPIIVAVINVYFAALKIELQILANFWNNILLPAITAVWNFLKTYIIPIIVALVDVHIAVLQRALLELTRIWDTVFKPVLVATWDFLQGFLMPALKLLANSAIETVKTAAQGAGNVWDKTLKPALTAVWNVITSMVTPAMSTLTGVIDGVKSAIGGIASVVSGAVSALHRLADAIRSLPSLPGGGGIPGFASGTSFAPGGLALVGERGPELVNLPRGSQVIPAQQTQQLLGPTKVQNFYLTANYSRAQSESSLMNDVRMMQLLGKGV